MVILIYNQKWIQDFWKNNKINNNSLHDVHRAFIKSYIIKIFKKTEYWGDGIGERGEIVSGIKNTNFEWINGILEKHQDQERWSYINFWDNNSLFFATCLNLLNRKYKDDPIDFKTGNIFVEWDKYKKYFIENLKEIFHPKGKFFPELMECVYITKGIGQSNFDYAIEILESRDDVKNIKEYNDGNKKDLKGIDAEFELNGITKTLQIKTFSKTDMIIENDKYIFNVSSWNYNVDFIAFSNSRIEEVYFFNNVKYDSINHCYEFSKSSLWFSNKKPVLIF